MPDQIRIYTRAEWGASQVAQNFGRKSALGVVLHNMQNHNRTPSADAEAERQIAFHISRDCQHDHMTDPDKKWSDIGQNFTISRGGVIMEARKGSLDAAQAGRVVQGAHASGVTLYNTQYHGIELEGDLRHDYAITPQQHTALINLCAHLAKWAGHETLDDFILIPHAEVLEGHTDCPGLLIDHMPEVRVAVRARLNELGSGGGPGDAPPPPVAPVLTWSSFRGQPSLEAVAGGHLVLAATGGRVDGIGEVQEALNTLGFPINLGADDRFKGFFGEKTEGALRAFQESTPAIEEMPGRVDRTTILELDAAMVAFHAPPAAPAPSSPAPHVAAAGTLPWSQATVFATVEENAGGAGDIRPIKIRQFSARPAFFYKAAMAIDVDGSPRAYRFDADSPEPLDGPGSVDAEGFATMYIQGRTKTVHGQTHKGEGPYPGFYVSRTSLLYRGSDAYKTSNFVDAEFIPFIVFPWSEKKPDRFPNVRLGDLAYVIDTVTKRATHAILADTNPRVGEASLRVARNLGRNNLSAFNGDEDDRYLYILFPGTKFEPLDSVPHWPDEKIKEQADQAFAAWGGMAQAEIVMAHV